MANTPPVFIEGDELEEILRNMKAFCDAYNIHYPLDPELLIQFFPFAGWLHVSRKDHTTFQNMPRQQLLRRARELQGKCRLLEKSLQQAEQQKKELRDKVGSNQWDNLPQADIIVKNAIAEIRQVIESAPGRPPAISSQILEICDKIDKNEQ